MKTGDLIKYKVPWDGVDFIGIILEVLDGFHLRKSWSDKCQFIKKPMLRIYWLCEPSGKPVAAAGQMMAEPWPLPGTESTGLLETTRDVLVDEWDKITKESNWYFSEHFLLIEKREV
tara:strand:+ start:3237 stop:3587 length:351 start_codon:yes stop_codon:yes gene_type:complete